MGKESRNSTEEILPNLHKGQVNCWCDSHETKKAGICAARNTAITKSV